MAKSVEVLRKLLELVEAGLVPSSVCEGLLNGKVVEWKLVGGVGEYDHGMLRVAGGVINFDPGRMLGAVVKPAAPELKPSDKKPSDKTPGFSKPSDKKPSDKTPGFSKPAATKPTAKPPKPFKLD